MTIEELNQYRALLREIKYYEQKLEKLHDPMLRDRVLASIGPGYTLMEVSVFGPRGNRDRIERRYAACKAWAEHARDGIDAYISGIGQAHIRELFRWRFVEGLSWRAVAANTGSSEDSVKKAVYRYLTVNS